LSDIYKHTDHLYCGLAIALFDIDTCDTILSAQVQLYTLLLSKSIWESVCRMWYFCSLKFVASIFTLHFSLH